jgi:L-amino acid N-acyltransferase YncA
MCGKARDVPLGQVDVSDLDMTPDSGLAIGEIAPRYWAPIVIGNQAPSTFWKEIVISDKPKTYNEGDLDGASPWWSMYQDQDSCLLLPWVHPEVTGVDPDETKNERIARETDKGSNFHAENRKEKEKAKKDAETKKRKQQQEKAAKLGKGLKSIDAPKKIKPGINIYIRAAKPEDISSIREIYNYYVTYSTYTPEIQPRTKRDMQSRLEDVRDNSFPFLVVCQRGEKLTGRGKKRREEPITLPEKVIGFGFADDYNDMLGMYRFTAELEIYIHHDNYLKGLGKCLMDKLLGLLDPEYIEHGGYDIEGDEAEGIGARRMTKNIIVNLPYEKPEVLEWKARWLTDWCGFGQVGNLEGVGCKDGKTYETRSLCFGRDFN